MTTTTIDISALSESTAEQIAESLIEDGEELLANVIIRCHGNPCLVVDNGDGELMTSTMDPRAAAQEYVDGGDWPDWEVRTYWVRVSTWKRYALGDHLAFDDDDTRQDVTVAIDPTPPACPEGDHEWTSPHEVVGGCEFSPGVFGHGGGAIVKEVCHHCGALKITDTWAQCPETGEQGLTSVHYERGGSHDYSDAWEAWKDELDEQDY
jgi:hypothetical protein